MKPLVVVDHDTGLVALLQDGNNELLSPREAENLWLSLQALSLSPFPTTLGSDLVVDFEDMPAFIDALEKAVQLCRMIAVGE